MLKIDHLVLHFDGLAATDDVCMEAEEGKVTALIGPNGAGKTTLFNQIAGVYRPESGQILLDGENIAGLRPYQICSRGITRTYQQIKLFSQMSALDNVLVGMHTRFRLNLLQDIFHSKKMRQQEHESREKALELLRFVGLEDVAALPAGSLPYGKQRLLEIARALAPNPKYLLLDEPAAGMNTTEKAELRNTVAGILARGITVLIVEHDMSLIMNIADRIYVLNSGKNLAEGSPAEIANDPRVIEAYLGTEDA